MPCNLTMRRTESSTAHIIHNPPYPTPLATKYRVKRASRFSFRANEHRAYRFESSTIDRGRYPSDPHLPTPQTPTTAPTLKKIQVMDAKTASPRSTRCFVASSKIARIKYNTFSLSHLFGVMNVLLIHLRSTQTSSLLPTCLCCCRMDIQSEMAFSA